MPRGRPRRGAGRRPYALRNRQPRRQLAEQPAPQYPRNQPAVQPAQAPQHPRNQPADCDNGAHLVQPPVQQLPVQNQVPPQIGGDQAVDNSSQTPAQHGNEIICNLYTGPVQQIEPLLVPGFSNEIDIFIPQSLKEKAWNFEYVELSLFLRQNFESNIGQKPCNLEIVDGKLVIQQRIKKVKSIDNISNWTSAFLNYILVITENHPSKASELIKYITILRNAAAEFPASKWLLYDQQFRLRISRNPSRSWANIDGELWLRFIASAATNSVFSFKNNSRYACYDYNYKGICTKAVCSYRHICLKCQLQHPSIHCNNNLGFGPPNPQAHVQQIRGQFNRALPIVNRSNHQVRLRHPSNVR